MLYTNSFHSHGINKRPKNSPGDGLDTKTSLTRKYIVGDMGAKTESQNGYSSVSRVSYTLSCCMRGCLCVSSRLRHAKYEVVLKHTKGLSWFYAMNAWWSPCRILCRVILHCGETIPIQAVAPTRWLRWFHLGRLICHLLLGLNTTIKMIYTTDENDKLSLTRIKPWRNQVRRRKPRWSHILHLLYK